MRLGDTPVLIPNTMVKTLAADGTMLETAWESRWLPDYNKNKAERLSNIENPSERMFKYNTLDLPVIQDLEQLPGFE